MRPDRRPLRARWSGLLALAALALAGDAWARDCGGTRLCKCGNRVTQAYKLPHDLGPCPKNGLEIIGPIEFDGGGHVISGLGLGVGIRLRMEGTGSKVRNVKVTAFDDGIRLQGVHGALIENVEAYRNGNPATHEGYGIDLTKEATKNVMSRVRVHDNADEGIHVGAFSRGNRIVDSEIWGNYRENVYFLANDGSRLERSKVHSSGNDSANVYIKHSRNSVVEKNTITDGAVQVRGPSDGTHLVENVLTRASVVLQESDDKRFGRGRPIRTTIEGGSIEAKETCVRVDSASEVLIEKVKLECRKAVTIDGASQVSLLDVEDASIRCKGDGGARRLAAVDVRFVDGKGAPRSGVKLRNRGAGTVGEAGADGRLRATVEIARLGCPARDWSSAGDLIAVTASGEQVVAIEKLRGDVVLPESAGQP